MMRMLLLGLAFPVLALACGEPPPTSLVVITLDTTRVDHLSTYGYERKTTPELDALAARSVVFDRAWSTSAWTLPAHASLFTGLYPATHGARFDWSGDAVLGTRIRLPVAQYVRAGKLADDHTTLAELVAEQGYRTGAFVAGPWLHRTFGLMQGFETVDDDVSTYGGRSAEVITDRAIEWLRGLSNSQPFFLFVNYFDPHAPFTPPGGYDGLPHARHPEPNLGEILAEDRELEPREREILVDRYDGEIRFMDHHLGRLIQALESKPTGRAALVIVTADHGEAFGEGGRIGHTFWLSEEVLRVPLIVRHPDDRDAGTRSDSPVQLVDLLPLVADELGLELPESVQGVAPGGRSAVFAELYREPTTTLRFGDRFNRDLGAVIVWPHKLVRSSRGEQSLASLSATGTQQSGHEDQELAGRLAELLDEHERSVARGGITPPDVDQRTVEALRSLGYID